MKLTVPQQIRLMNEAGMSRRDFLKLMGKAAASSMAPPEALLSGGEQLAKMAMGQGMAKVPVRIDFFPKATSWQNGIPKEKLSDKLKEVSGLFSLIKRLLGGDVYSDYDYGEYKMYQKGEVNLPELVKKLGLEKLPPATFSGPRDPVTGERTKIKKDEGIWVVETPFGNIQLTELDKWNDLWGSEENTEYWKGAKKVLNPIKDYWEQVGRDLITRRSYDYDYSGDGKPKVKRVNQEDYFDEEGLKQLEEVGVDANSVKMQRQAELREQDQFIRDETGEDEAPEVLEPRVPRFAGRETGYERQSRFDPRSSRPAQALGPFESRLVDKLKLV